MVAEWSTSQYFFARRYGMLKPSEGWLVLLIKLMATSSFTLWDSRNQSRHGPDAATKAQLLKEQPNGSYNALSALGSGPHARSISLPHYRPATSGGIRHPATLLAHPLQEAYCT
jgi:hypothetical protein